MFTGIVEELGRVDSLTMGADSARLAIHGPLVASDATHGASIAVNGVCLTVTDHSDQGFAVDVMAESLNRSTLGALVGGDPVNLERAMLADGRFGGHVVQGHVDGTGTVLSRQAGDRWEVVTIGLPPGLRRYVALKGSIAVDGVSLTVSGLDDESFEVSLIPTTLASTTLGSRGVGERVNLEVDVIAKYVERLLTTGEAQAAPIDGDRS